jgi:hypothetical protein
MEAWKRATGAVREPRANRLAAAAYLQSGAIVVRDLSDSLGFDRAGVTKLFDFNFAIGLPPTGLLYDRYGSPRYMELEVRLSQGYGAAADAYCFGVHLWEHCAPETPFAAIARPEKFERAIFRGGQRSGRDPVGENIGHVYVGRCVVRSDAAQTSGTTEYDGILYVGYNASGIVRRVYVGCAVVVLANRSVYFRKLSVPHAARERIGRHREGTNHLVSHDEALVSCLK